MRKDQVAFILVILVLVIYISTLWQDSQDLKNQSHIDMLRYQDSIAYYSIINQQIELENRPLLTINDSLKSLPPKIKTVYREKYIIIDHSDINQLDSIIRASF